MERWRNLVTLTYDELLALTPGEIPSGAADQAERLDELVALLDCTGGFYSSQRWRGVRISRLLDLAQPHVDARYVSFISVTSYRWSLPLDEARQALLATHSGRRRAFARSWSAAAARCAGTAGLRMGEVDHAHRTANGARPRGTHSDPHQQLHS